LKRRHRFERLRAVLNDATACTFNIVHTAERLPVLETDEFHAELTANGVHVGALIVNRRSPATEGEFLASRRRYEDEALADLHRRLPDLLVVEVPLRAHDVGSPRALEDIANYLYAQYALFGLRFDIAKAHAQGQADVIGQSYTTDIRGNEETSIANFWCWPQIESSKFHVFGVDTCRVQDCSDYFQHLLRASFCCVRAVGQRRR